MRKHCLKKLLMPQEMHVYIFIYLICIFKLYILTNTYNMLFFFFKVFLSSQGQHPPQRCLLFETPPLWRVWLKLLLKIVLFEMVHLQAPAKWVWNLLHLMCTVTHTTAYASLCSLSEAAWCLLISAKPCVGFFCVTICFPLFLLDVIWLCVLRFCTIFPLWKTLLWKYCILLPLCTTLPVGFVWAPG